MGQKIDVKRTWEKANVRDHAAYVVGFACAMSWSPTLLMAASPENALGMLVTKPPHGSCMPSLIASALACLLIALGGAKGAARLFHAVRPVGLGAAMALIGFVFFLVFATDRSLVVFDVGMIALSGVLVVLLYLLWMRVFGAMPVREMFVALFFAQVLKCAIDAFLSVANMYTVIAASVVLPLASVVCLRACREPEESVFAREPSNATTERVPNRLLLKLAAVVFVWGAIDHLFRGEFDALVRNEGTQFGIAYHAAAFVVVVAAVSYAYALFAFKERFGFGHLYRMIFLMGLASVLLLPTATSDVAAVLGYACSVVMYHLVFLFVWVIAASAFRNRPEDAPGLFGLVYGCWSLGSLVGAYSGSQTVGYAADGSIHAIVFAAALAAAVGYAAVFTEADANALVRIMPFKRKTPFKDKCLAVAQAYKLSPRETEIAMLIAQGRDSAHIEKKLFLSRSTVQTHRMHLYQKLDIHNRQELLDIIEAAEAAGATSAR